MITATGNLLCNRYQLIEKIGVGGFSDVWKAKDTLARMEVVLKIFLRQDDIGVRLCREEYQRLVMLNHPHIVRILSLEVHENSPILVMPYYPGGAAISLMGRIDEAEAARMIAQIAGALDYIHQLPKPILHNDIKPDNFLLDLYSNYVLTDFGISEQLTERFTKSVAADRMQKPKNKARYGVTPMTYRAPELFHYREHRRKKNSSAADIWSFGASLYEMMANEPPFGGDGGLLLLVNNVSSPQYLDELLPQVPPHFSSGLVKLVKSCLVAQPEERPTAKSLKEAAEHWLVYREWQMHNQHPQNAKTVAIEHVRHHPRPSVVETIEHNVEKKERKSRVRGFDASIMRSLLMLGLILLPVGIMAVYYHREHNKHYQFAALLHGSVA